MMMHTDQYSDKLRTPMAAGLALYAEEILHAGWNPAVPHLINDVARCARTRELCEEESTFDVDAFLDRVYALATQI